MNWRDYGIRNETVVRRNESPFLTTNSPSASHSLRPSTQIRVVVLSSSYCFIMMVGVRQLTALTLSSIFMVIAGSFFWFFLLRDWRFRYWFYYEVRVSRAYIHDHNACIFQSKHSMSTMDYLSTLNIPTSSRVPSLGSVSLIRLRLRPGRGTVSEGY